MDSLRIATEPEPIELAWRLLRPPLATVQFLKHDLGLNPLSYPNHAFNHVLESYLHILAS